MGTNLAWYTARSAGLVAWFLLACSIGVGLLQPTRLLGRRPSPKWVLDLHRGLAALTVTFVGVHLVGLLADTYVAFSLTQLLVPLAATYRPLPVAWGIVGFYLLLAIEISSLLKRHMSLRAWRAIHLSSYGLFIFATVHLLTAGTDATNTLLRWSLVLSTATLVVLTLLRITTVKKNQRPAAARGSARQAQRAPRHASSAPRQAQAAPRRTKTATRRGQPTWARQAPASPPLRP